MGTPCSCDNCGKDSAIQQAREEGATEEYERVKKYVIDEFGLEDWTAIENLMAIGQHEGEN
jgi:hypothetical protein